MLELLIRILCDTQPPAATDGVFLFGQTADNEASVLGRAQQLLDSGRAARILFGDSPPANGYPGFAAWKSQLLGRGVAEASIIGVPIPAVPVLHTLIEAEAVVKYAKEHQLSSLYISAAPFHQPRAFMTAVTAALRSYPVLRLYSQPGTALPWTEEAVHSQGKAQGPRHALIGGEMERIAAYQKKQDLASAEQVLAYLNQRDR
jgi:hypothetical protein